MKSKKSTYFLIIVVLVIWSIIIVKVFSFTNEDFLVENRPPVNIEKINFERKTYDLLMDYPDPFIVEKSGLRRKSKQTFNSTRASNQKVIKTNIKKSVVDSEEVPEIIYTGMFENKNSNKRFALLIINRKELVVKKGEEREGLFIQEIWQDSIGIRYNKNNIIVIKGSRSD